MRRYLAYADVSVFHKQPRAHGKRISVCAEKCTRDISVHNLGRPTLIRSPLYGKGHVFLRRVKPTKSEARTRSEGVANVPPPAPPPPTKKQKQKTPQSHSCFLRAAVPSARDVASLQHTQLISVRALRARYLASKCPFRFQ